MTRALRGMRARARPLLVLAAVAAVVTAGVVTVLAFADAAGTSAGLVLPLVLIGVVALPTAGRELAEARRGEIAVARLRGVTGWRLTRLLLGEPLLALATGAVAGVLLGGLTAWLTTGWWLGEASTGLGGRALLAASAVVVGGALVVLVGLSAARRTPLGEQIARHTRPQRATTWGLFWGVLVVVAAGVAVYRAGLGQDPDALVLLGPALLGLAAGQVLWWLLRVLSPLLVARTVGSEPPLFLAVRRLGRSDAASALRVLVAAGVVGVLAASGAARVGAWSEETARLTAGAPVRVDLDADASEALALAREADPDGRWLMAAAAVPDPLAERRRVFVDTTRYDRVVGGFLDGTGAAGVAEYADGLAVAPPERFAGRELVVDLAEPDLDLLVQGRLDMSLADGTEISKNAYVLSRDFLAPGQERSTTLRYRVGACARGCTVASLTFTPQRRQNNGQAGADLTPVPRTALTVTSIRLGETDLLDQEWAISPFADQTVPPATIEQTADGLVLTTGADGEIAIAPAGPGRTLPVVATEGLRPSATFGDGAALASVLTPGADARLVEVVGEVAALPMIGTAGALGDLPTFLDGSSPSVPSAEVAVLARDDTPAAVLTALTDAGGQPRTWQQIRDDEERATGASQARVYALMAGFCLVVAGLVLLAASSRQRPAYRHDVAALRVAGVGTRAIDGAARREVWLTTVVTALGALAGGVAGSALLLTHLPLVEVPEYGVPLPDARAVLPTLVVALVLAVVVLAAGTWSRRVDPVATRPAVLREEVGG